MIVTSSKDDHVKYIHQPNSVYKLTRDVNKGDGTIYGILVFSGDDAFPGELGMVCTLRYSLHTFRKLDKDEVISYMI
jgi:hypothetical protein